MLPSAAWISAPASVASSTAVRSISWSSRASIVRPSVILPRLFALDVLLESEFSADLCRSQPPRPAWNRDCRKSSSSIRLAVSAQTSSTIFPCRVVTGAEFGVRQSTASSNSRRRFEIEADNVEQPVGDVSSPRQRQSGPGEWHVHDLDTEKLTIERLTVDFHRKLDRLCGLRPVFPAKTVLCANCRRLWLSPSWRLT